MKRKQTIKTYNYNKQICCKFECKNIIHFAKKSWKKRLRKELKEDVNKTL